MQDNTTRGHAAIQLQRAGIILFTNDYDGCVAFYRDALGLPVLGQQPDLTVFDFGGAYLMIETPGPKSSGRRQRDQNPTVLRFDVDDVHATAVALATRGVQVTQRQFDWGTIGVFYDPDGNRCELKGRA